MTESEANKGVAGEPRGSEGALIFPSRAERLETETNEEEEREENRRKLHLIFNGIVAVTSALTVCVLIYQARVMQYTLRQVQIQSVAANKNAEAAQIQAQASQESVKAIQSQFGKINALGWPSLWIGLLLKAPLVKLSGSLFMQLEISRWLYRCA